jgi:sugar phosphate isomerase/epimerase
MSHARTRREFLQASSSLLAGIGMTSLLPTLAAAKANARLCVSCRDANLPRHGFGDCWAALKHIGAEGVEVSVGEDLSLGTMFHPAKKYSVATASGVQEFKADAAVAGQQVPALLLANNFAKRPEFEIEWCTRAAQAAQALGAKAIRIDVVAHQAMPSDTFLDLAVSTLKKILKKTESTGVAFGVENHGPANNPEFLKPLIERVGSPRFGLTLDTGNFYWYGFPRSKLYELFDMFAPHVVHTHCKSIKFPADKRNVQRPIGWEYERYTCPLYEGDIDFVRVVSILDKVGYANDLCIEDESLGHFAESERPAVLKKEVEYLKGLL